KIVQFHHSKIKFVTSMKVEKKIDVVLEDLRKSQNVLRRKARRDTALVKAVPDGAPNHSRLSNKGNLFAFYGPPIHRGLYANQVIIDNQLHSLHASVFRAKHDLNVVTGTNLLGI